MITIPPSFIDRVYVIVMEYLIELLSLLGWT